MTFQKFKIFRRKNGMLNEWERQPATKHRTILISIQRHALINWYWTVWVENHDGLHRGLWTCPLLGPEKRIKRHNFIILLKLLQGAYKLALFFFILSIITLAIVLSSELNRSFFSISILLTSGNVILSVDSALASGITKANSIPRYS